MLLNPLTIATPDPSAQIGIAIPSARPARRSREISHSAAMATPIPPITSTDAWESQAITNPARPRTSKRPAEALRSSRSRPTRASTTAAVASTSYCLTSAPYLMKGIPMANSPTAKGTARPSSARSASRRNRNTPATPHTNGNSLNASSFSPSASTASFSTKRNPRGATWSSWSGWVSDSRRDKARMLRDRRISSSQSNGSPA